MAGFAPPDGPGAWPPRTQRLRSLRRFAQYAGAVRGALGRVRASALGGGPIAVQRLADNDAAGRLQAASAAIC